MNAPKTLLIGVALAASAAAPASAYATELVAHTDLVLRRGPGTKFSTVTTVGTGEKITVLWCNGTAKWCLVDDGLLQGWTPIDTLRRIPLSGTTASGGGAGLPSASTLGDSGVPEVQGASAAGNGSGGVNLSVGGNAVSAGAGAAIRAAVP